MFRMRGLACLNLIGVDSLLNVGGFIGVEGRRWSVNIES